MDRFTYTGIRVRDLDRSLRFYTRVMGMHEFLRGTMEHGGVYVHLKAPGSTQRLELNWYPRSSPHYRPYRSGEELDHLAWWVRDVPAVFRRLVRRGAKPQIPPWREGRWELAFVSDPDGIWIELIGRALGPRRAARGRRAAPPRMQGAARISTEPF
ncbi:MAG TPA: VOC family protein [Thermoplasmata archaeon]|nr:VOC family protein [Thermoplasmata archaeon]